MNKKIALLCVTCLAVAAALLEMKKLSVGQKPTGIMISEVCSKNERVIYDSTGEYIDYVELYNPLDYAVDLSGYRLSDNAAFENAYIIEEGIIESGQYKVIFPKSFGISDYEIVYLLDSSLNVLDSVHIPILAADSSFAKDLKRNKWSVMQPTPEKTNLIEQEKDTLFSEELAAPEGTEVYYTLDGTEPTAEAEQYREPIYIEDISYKENLYAGREDISTRDEVYIPCDPVDKINVIRAIAVNSEGQKSHEAIGTYFVGYGEKSGYDNLYILSIITDPANLYDYEKGIYVKGKVWETNWDEKKAQDSSVYKNSVGQLQNGRKGLEKKRLSGDIWKKLPVEI